VRRFEFSEKNYRPLDDGSIPARSADSRSRYSNDAVRLAAPSRSENLPLLFPPDISNNDNARGRSTKPDVFVFELAGLAGELKFLSLARKRSHADGNHAMRNALIPSLVSSLVSTIHVERFHRRADRFAFRAFGSCFERLDSVCAAAI